MAEDLTHRSGLSVDDYRALTGFDGDWRDTWWDDDFLAMMGRKWRLHEVRTALDVGAGVGHWGQRLLRHMDEAATLSGIDAEPTWVSFPKRSGRAASVVPASLQWWDLRDVSSRYWRPPSAGLPSSAGSSSGSSRVGAPRP